MRKFMSASVFSRKGTELHGKGWVLVCFYSRGLQVAFPFAVERLVLLCTESGTLHLWEDNACQCIATHKLLAASKLQHLQNFQIFWKI